MKLVLIIPPSPWLMSDRDQPMMGILYVASYIKNMGFHEVQVCDLSSIPEDHWHIPIGDVYGITGVTPQFVYMKKIIDRLKEREPHRPIVCGGVHATVLPEHLLKNGADYVVIGDGELAMADLLTALNFNKPPKTQRIVAPLTDIDHLPYPDRKSIDYYEYMKPQTYSYLDHSVREASIITSRGCPYKCAYCASNKIHNGKVRFRSAWDVANELRYLKNQFNIGLCNFVDDTFIINRHRVKEICRLIKPLNIKWFFLTRVDHVDLDLFKIMKDSGCVSVTFGFESGSDRMLKHLKKNTTIKQAYKAIEISKEAGLKIRGQLMVGMPGEKDTDVEMTADFIRNTRNDVTKFGIHVFRPIPGCDIWEFPENYDYEFNKNTDFSDFHTIGKEDLSIKDQVVKHWFDYLRQVAAEKNIDK